MLFPKTEDDPTQCCENNTLFLPWTDFSPSYQREKVAQVFSLVWWRGRICLKNPLNICSFNFLNGYCGGSALTRDESTGRRPLSLHIPASILQINPFLSSHGVNFHTPSRILKATHGRGWRGSTAGLRMPQLDCSVGVPSNHLKVSSVEKLLTYYEWCTWRPV